MNLPLITSAPHNSNDFAEFSERVALDGWQRKEMSDEYTADTAFHPNALANIKAEASRALGDLNRDKSRAFYNKDFLENPIWKKGQELSVEEKDYCLKTFYDLYYDEIKHLIKKSKEKGFDKILLWDQHDTGDFNPHTGNHDRKLPSDNRPMPNLVISNFGLENSGETNPSNGYVTCPPQFIQTIQKLIAEEFSLQTHDVEINTSYKGGNIIQYFGTPKNDFGNTVYAIQVEYNRGLVMDQKTREPYWDKIKDFNKKFNRVMEKACELF